MATRRSSAGLVAVLVLALGAALSVLLGVFRSGPAVAVQTAAIRRTDVVATLAYRGRLTCRDEVNLSSRIVGRVEQVLVAEGERVRRDQPLVTFDARRERALLEASRAGVAEQRVSLEQAEAQFERASRLFDAQLIATSEYQNAKTTVALAQARLNSALASLESQEHELDSFTVRSPIDGVITNLTVKEGAVAVVGAVNNPATVMLTIGDPRRIEVEVELNEPDLGRLHLGARAEVRVDAYGDTVLHGSIVRYGARAETRSLGRDAEETFVKAYVGLMARPAFLKPGLSAKVRLTFGAARNALAVPLQAVLRRDVADEASRLDASVADVSLSSVASATEQRATPPPGVRDGVYVIDDHARVRFVPVRTDLASDDIIAVQGDGLQEGDRIVIGPFRVLDGLRSGQLVREEGPRRSPR